jgi:hypothetical protein
MRMTASSVHPETDRSRDGEGYLQLLGEEAARLADEKKVQSCLAHRESTCFSSYDTLNVVCRRGL